MNTHYNTLGVEETATQEEIKKSYKNLSKKYHPDRPEGDEKKFKEINKAYEELSDPQKRRQYDLSFRGNISNSTPYGHYNSAKAFEQFFGARFTRSPKTKPRNRDINHTLKVTLKEIYTGVAKKFRVKRHRVRPGTNEVYLEDKLLSVQIPPGISSGRSVMIKGEGNQYPGETFPGEILLKIIETNDTPFKRSGQNLIYPVKLNLKSALTGFQLNINHLDGHKLKVPITDIIRPGMERIIQGEGLSFYNNTSKKGALIIRFEVEFPMSLDAEVKQQLKQLL